MIKKLSTLYDVKAEYFLPPSCVHSEEDAKRQFSSVFHGDSPISQHPEDFRVFELGAFDDNAGVLVPHDQPKFICELKELDFRPKPHIEE